MIGAAVRNQHGDDVNMPKTNKLSRKTFMRAAFNNAFEFDNVKIRSCMYVYVYGRMYHPINCLESIFVLPCCRKESGDDLAGDALRVAHGR